MDAPSPSTSAVIQEILVHNFNDECEECISQVAQILDLIREAEIKARLGMVEYYDQCTDNKLMDWKGLFAENRQVLKAELEATQPNESKGGEDR